LANASYKFRNYRWRRDWTRRKAQGRDGVG
jgi:hypothetical protein